MGARTPQSVKDEITQIRRGLDTKLDELEGRIPPLLKFARRAAVVAAGGGAGGGVLYTALRVRRRRAKRNAALPVAAPSAQVGVLPRGAVAAALGVAAIWAGVRIYEVRMRYTSDGKSGGDLRVLRGRRTAGTASGS